MSLSCFESIIRYKDEYKEKYEIIILSLPQTSKPATRISNSQSFNIKLIPLTFGFKLINISIIIFKILLTDKKPLKNSFAKSNKSKLK